MQKAQWLNEHQVSEITGIAAQTLRNHRYHRKGIQYSKVGGRVYYKLADVEAFMDSHRITFN